MAGFEHYLAYAVDKTMALTIYLAQETGHNSEYKMNSAFLGYQRDQTTLL